MFLQMMLKENEIRGVNNNENTKNLPSALKTQNQSPKVAGVNNNINVSFKDDKAQTAMSAADGFRKGFPEIARSTDRSHDMRSGAGL